MALSFDDLPDEVAAPKVGGLSFDDLPEEGAPVAQAFVPPMATSAGQVMMDDGQMQAPLPPLVREYAQNPRVQAAQAIKRGTLAGEAAAFGPMMNQAFHQTLIPSMMDYQQSGAADRSAAADATWRANMLDGGLEQLDPRQRQMAMLDPTLAAQQMGDQPGRPLTTADEQMQIARDRIAAAIPKEASFGQQQRLDEAEAQAVPSYDTAEGTLGKIFAGAGSATAALGGSLPAVENLIPVGRGLTLAKTFAKGAGVNAATGVITDPVVQANQMGAGMRDKYSGEQTALAGVLGGVLGGTLNAAPQAIGNAIGKFRGWIETRAAKRLEDMAPDEAAQWFQQAQAASEAAGRAVDDPAFTADMVQQNTGLNAARPTDPASVAAQRQANKVRGSELAETFNDVNVWPRDKVQVGPEGIDIPDGTPPVRDAAGEQARVDTLAPRGQAAAMLREMGVENASARDIDIIVKYIQGGQSPRGAVNSFRRAATQAERGERGMTPDLARTEGEQANSRQFAKDAFDIAELRRQRREKDLDDWEPDLQADYSAGAPRADDITPRMAQDLAARSQEPAPGVGTNQPAPRRSVDVIGSKSVGGLRGEYLPGGRPGAPEVPPVGRTGDMFEGERTEPRLEGPAEAPVREQPVEATAETRPVEPVAPEPRADVPEWRQKPKDPPNRERENGFRYEQWEKQQYEDASPEVKAQADDLEARASAEYTKYHQMNRNGDAGYNKPRPTEAEQLQAAKHKLEWSRLGQERSRLLRGSDDLMNPIARDNHANEAQRVADWEERFNAKNPAPKAEPEAAARTPEQQERIDVVKRGNEATRRILDEERAKGPSNKANIKHWEQELKDSDARLERVLAEDGRAPSRWSNDPKWDEYRRIHGLQEGGTPFNSDKIKPPKREAPASPTPEAPASPKADEGPANAEKLRQLEHELSLARYFEDDPKDIADLQRQVDELKAGQKAPDEGPTVAELRQRARDLDAQASEARLNRDLPGARELQRERVAVRDQIDQMEGRESTPTRNRVRDELDQRLSEDTAKALDDRLSRVNWDEKGGKLLRDDAGKAAGRTKWLSNDPDVHKVLTEFGYSSTEARNLLNRAATGKGRPLTEKQQRFVSDLVEAHRGPQEDAGDDFALDSHTDSDLQARERDAKQAQDQADKRRTAAENKAQADKDRDDFTLSGSDRTADVAASRGQNTLFDVTGAAVHSGKTAIEAVGKGIKALVKAIWQGDDSRTAREHARDLADPLAQLIERKGPSVEGRFRAGIRKFFDSAEASLKELTNKTDSPTLQQLGDVFHATAGKGDGTKPTLDERSQRALFGGKKGYMNRAEGIHNFMHDNKLEGAQAVDQIIKLVENPGTPRTGKIGEAANLISDFFKDAHAYLKDAGIDMGEVKGYFPREHDVTLVESKRTQFVDAAAKAYKQDAPALSPTDARAKAEEYWSAVVHGRDVPPGSGANASNNPKPDFMKGRIFSKAAAKHLEPFYSRNVGGMLSNYALRAVRRAEVAKSGVDIDGKFQPFGDNFANWKTITDAALKEDPKAREVLDQVNQLVSVNAGIPTSNYGRTAENTMAWVRTAGTLGMLEKSALASVGELATSPLRGAIGNAGDIANIAQNLGGHAINTLRAVVGKKGRSQSVKEAFAFSDEIGATTESQQGSTAAARFEGNEPGSKLQNQLLTSFFKRNMLTPLTEYTRALSAQQARIFMKRLAADRQRTGANAVKSDLLLRELGVPKGKEAAFAAYVKDFGDKLPTADDLKGEFGDLYKNMALRFVDQSVQRPNAATKPAWASHPLGKMVFQFQSFNYAFQKNVLNRMVRLAVLNKDMSAAQKASLGASFGLSVGAMTGIQAMITELREKAYSRPDQKKLTPGAKMEGTVSRTGLLGVADPWIQMVNGGVRYGRDPSQSLLGPALGQASGTLGAFLGPDSDKTNTKERKEARMLYQTFGEPLAQAALSALPAGPLVKAATVYGVPKAGEVLTDEFIPDNKKRTKADDKPIKGMVESVADLFKGKEEEKATGPKRAVRPARPQRPVKP